MGFADGIIAPASPPVDMANEKPGTLFSRQAADTVLVNKLRDICTALNEEQDSVDAAALYARLEALK